MAEALAAEHGANAVRRAVERAKAAKPKNVAGFVRSILPEVAAELRKDAQRAEREAERRAEREHEQQREREQRAAERREWFESMTDDQLAAFADVATAAEAMALARGRLALTPSEPDYYATQRLPRKVAAAEKAAEQAAEDERRRQEQAERDAATLERWDELTEDDREKAVARLVELQAGSETDTSMHRFVATVTRKHVENRSAETIGDALDALDGNYERARPPAAGGEVATAATTPPDARNAADATHGDERGTLAPNRVASRTDGGPSTTRASGVA